IITSNLSSRAICWITLLARSCTADNSSLRRRFRSSRNSRCIRCRSRFLLARSRSLSRRSASGMVTPSFSSALCRSRICLESFWISASRPANSFSSFCWARFAGAASRKSRSLLMNPILTSDAWASAGVLVAANITMPATPINNCCVRCFKVRSCVSLCLENRSDLKLKVLDLVVGSFVQRDAIAELEGPDWRVPRHPGTRGIAERLEVRLEATVVDPSRVHKDRQAHRPVPRLHSGHREEKLCIADDLLPASYGVSGEVLRP